MSVSRTMEPYMNLSLDLTHNHSIYSAIKKLSHVERLEADQQYQCDYCGGLRDAERRQKIVRLPPVLCVHLKRFKYNENLNILERIHYRCAFPLELRLTTEKPDDDSKVDPTPSCGATSSNTLNLPHTHTHTRTHTHTNEHTRTRTHTQKHIRTHTHTTQNTHTLKENTTGGGHCTHHVHPQTSMRITIYWA
eukprot:GHVR01148631.1.p1 GENE.GHVR01148631.1~~GHVR01148631.1.p1  ORF type:complete len:192 (-),score=71.72 GHVR01148631.1:291-866(-)